MDQRGLSGKHYSIFRTLSDRRFWMFFGSGLIVSVAYMDPGNWGTNISGGANFNYDLLWVIWMASGMAMLFQYLSGKLGLAGYSLPELMRLKLKNKYAVLVYWFLSEFVILATDLAEFLGIVVALKLLFGIPMLWGTFIAVIDVLFILIFTQKRLRYLEMAFVVFVAIIGLAFLYEVIVSKPDMLSIIKGSIIVKLTAESALVAVGIIGATVMPHAIFVHSWLIKNKSHNIDFKNDEKTLFYHMTEDVLSLGIAALINAAMLIMSAAAFYGLGDKVATLEGAYVTLSPLFGNFASLIFAIALLAAGISSSITGALSGQAVMDGLTDFKVPMWVRRVITRVINVIPLTIAILLGIEPLKVLVYSQAVLSLLLPLPLIPLLIFTSDRKIMGELSNRRITSGVAVLFSAIIMAFNAYLILQLLSGKIA
ncbi:MAG: Nramp family divalent metal transporter [Candidatus Aenigmarchaeota archaeon]|nr:Nramp family divalent metal transporter [Candidatus Aenigmarchaeota archaeon]